MPEAYCRIYHYGCMLNIDTCIAAYRYRHFHSQMSGAVLQIRIRIRIH
jgi:hypothetical protein